MRKDTRPHVRPTPARRGAISILLVLLAALAASAENVAPAAVAVDGAQASQPGAVAAIESLHEGLLGVMKEAETLGYAGREEKLADIVPRHFDVEFMARKSLGRYWNQADEAERARYLATFERFMVANYAGRFDGWSGQSFVVEGESPAGQGTVLVQSRLDDPKDDDVELKYRLRPVDGGWKVIDVFLDGTVSELALRYSEFVSIVKREDIDALIAALDERIAKLARGEAS